MLSIPPFPRVTQQPIISSLISILTGNLVSMPNTLNIWAILWGNLAYFIGGGGTMAGAMCYTLFSDVTPAAERTMVFYQLNAVLRIVGVAATPLAAFLLGVNPWMALWIGIGLLVVGTGCTLLLPETLDLRKMADQRGSSRDALAHSAPQEMAKVSAKSAVQQALASARSDFAHIWRFVLGSQSIMLLMVCNALAFPLRLVFDGDLLQYMTKRFHWSWSTVEFCPSIRSGEATTNLFYAGYIHCVYRKLFCPGSAHDCTTSDSLGVGSRRPFTAPARLVPRSCVGSLCIPGHNTHCLCADWLALCTGPYNLQFCSGLLSLVPVDSLHHCRATYDRCPQYCHCDCGINDGSHIGTYSGLAFESRHGYWWCLDRASVHVYRFPGSTIRVGHFYVQVISGICSDLMRFNYCKLTFFMY